LAASDDDTHQQVGTNTVQLARATAVTRQLMGFGTGWREFGDTACHVLGCHMELGSAPVHGISLGAEGFTLLTELLGTLSNRGRVLLPPSGPRIKPLDEEEEVVGQGRLVPQQRWLFGILVVKNALLPVLFECGQQLGAARRKALLVGVFNGAFS